MWKQLTAQGNTQYLGVHVLLKILKQYNNTKHSSIKMTPVEASKKKNKSTVYFSLYGDMEQLSSKPRFKVGDKVRISKYKRKVFDKGYAPNWTDEIFLVDKTQSTNPITYRLKDLNNEEIQGSFYEPELLKAKQDVFRIDKVIRRDYKKKQAKDVAMTSIPGFHRAAYKIYLTNIYMDDFIRKLNTKIRNEETELGALYTKIQKLEEEIAALNHKTLISKKLETAEM